LFAGISFLFEYIFVSFTLQVFLIMQSTPKTFFQSFLRFIAPMAVAKKEYAVAIFLKLYESVLLLMSLNMLRLVTNYIAS